MKPIDVSINSTDHTVMLQLIQHEIDGGVDGCCVSEMDNDQFRLWCCRVISRFVNNDNEIQTVYLELQSRGGLVRPIKHIKINSVTATAFDYPNDT